MARPPRLSIVFERYANSVWFITITTARRHRWLAAPAVHAAFLDFAQRGFDGARAAIGRYVLMPDHAHLFVRLGHEQELGQWVKALKAVLLRAAEDDIVGWQPGFFDHLLRQSESYDQKWEYVRMNPVRAGLVHQPDDWPYQGEFCPLSFD
jgi:REP element-mobilizing transposase RayT